MLLLIDAGNTNCVFALHDGNEFKASWRCKTDSARSADEYAAMLYQLFQIKSLDFGMVKEAIISSVVPDANFQLQQLCKIHFECEAHFIGHDAVRPPVEILLRKPEEIGADRLVNAVAVNNTYKTPAIIIDFGTATTFDVVTAEGAYAGGIIAPGINLSLNALHAAAAKLPKIDIAAPEKVIGTNTVEAMQSGIYWGYVSMIEGLIGRLRNEINGSPVIVATGGLASIYAKNLKCINEVDQELTLKGLLTIYKSIKNAEQKVA